MRPLRFPAEWEKHRATWIAWPHEPTDWPGKIAAIDWVYVEIVRHLSKSETVEIICHSKDIQSRAAECLKTSGISENFRFTIQPNNRSWLRDSAPTLVWREEKREWVKWRFNGWAKYENFELDSKIPIKVSERSEIPLREAILANKKTPLVLEGGAIETDGEGTLLTTEECLLSTVQERNPGLSRTDYERYFAQYLGIEKTIWLDRSCEGDDTHGHIDDVARFVAPGKIVLAFESNPADPNHEPSVENLRRLKDAKDASGNSLSVTQLPFPRPIMYDGYRLPASYANFYIGNSVVLMPTFNDPRDSEALSILRDVFSDREVVGIHSVDLVLGLGTLHCLTQQEPAAS